MCSHLQNLRDYFLQSIHLDFRCNPDPCVLCFKCVIVAVFHIDHVIIRQFKMLMFNTKLLLFILGLHSGGQ